MVRLNDKVERLIDLLTNSKRPENETIEDTLRDIANYAVIWLIVRDGKWPNCSKYTISKEV